MGVWKVKYLRARLCVFGNGSTLGVTESWRKLGLGSLSLRSTLVNEAERFDL